MNRYIFGFLAAVGLIVLVIVLVVRSIVSTPSQAPATATATDITSYAGTNTTVQLTLDSAIGAPSEHHDVIINVGNNEATITVNEGYQGNVIQKQGYPMTTNAYAVFLRALKYNGFTQGDNNPNYKDERGQCALGNRYIYEILDQNQNDIQKYWYTSCGNGTFQGSVATIRRLFILQIPDYTTLTRGIGL